MVTGGKNISQQCISIFMKFEDLTKGLLIYDYERKQYHKECKVGDDYVRTDLVPFISKAKNNMNKTYIGFLNYFTYPERIKTRS